MSKPAARIGDMHVCPMVTPGLPPVPHVGGPITGPGMPTVLIGGVPAAVMGDMCTCVGPPDTIVLGSTGVFIGGKPAARMGDQCVHGGAITVGFPTVLIEETSPGGMSGGGSGTAKKGSSGTIAATVDAYKKAMNEMSPEATARAAQIVTLLEASADGTPFCEKCAVAILNS